MSSSQQQAFEVCERYVKDWAPSYAHHTRLVREVVGISTFTTVWSKPTKEKPISDILANVTVTVDLFGEVPSVSHALDSGFTSFTRQLRMEKVIEWHMADKRRVREVLRDIDHDRLQRPQPYVPVLHAPDSVAATQPPSSPAEGPGEEAGEASKPPLHAEAGLLTENDLELEAMLIKAA
ncbi:hypothetical protein T492DRAFT_878196 [Pavlovales sp. CCMP2436]|nr:hypothetical protein T492DRAFT_878196 [Pavlovales sp. CCMP2436]